jgi:ABC-type Fe3+-hydroxamate transport system substrate-binding protein
MINSTDQLGNKIKLDKIPDKIISLVPSQSELLWDLGLQKELIGITKFCIHPNKMFTSIAKIGGTKNINIEKVKSFNPDLIIANKEENQKEQIEELQKFFPVWISDIYNLTDALNMITELGKLLNKKNVADLLANSINNKFESINKIIKKKNVVYLIWQQPIMAASSNTFIDSMLNVCGFNNLIENKSSRYPEVSAKELINLNPDFVFLSSEPYPFKKNHIDFYKKLLPNSKVILVDGEFFSWYGSRLKFAPDYFNELLTSLI